MTTQTHSTTLSTTWLRKRLRQMLSRLGWIITLSLLISIALSSPATALCPGDLDGNHSVDGLDIATLAEQFGRTSCPTPESCTADIDGDNDVDQADLQLLSDDLGRTGCVNQTVVSGTISTDTTWTKAGSPYIVTGSITVQGTDGPDGVTTLTIEPGVEVRFNQNTQLSVGTNSGAPGALVAQGRQDAPIVFTASSPKEAGKWKGLFFDNTTDDTTTRLEYCTIEYAGDNVGTGQGAVYVGLAWPTLTNCTLRYGLGNGISIAGNNYYRPGETRPVITGCTISDFSGYGIYMHEGKATIDGNTFTGNGNYDIYIESPEAGTTVTNNSLVSGIRVPSGSLAAITGNQITYNDSRPLRLNADNVGELLAANTITNTSSASYLYVRGGTVSHDATWTALMPYRLDGSISIQGTDGPDHVTTLTIAPGAELRFGSGQQVSIGTNSSDPGALSAIGTSEAPIIFTSRTPKEAGKWKGIFFDVTTDDATTRLEYCNIEYAGDNVVSGQGAVNVGLAWPTLTNCTLRFGLGNGISIAGNNYYRPGETQPVITGCTISDFSGYGIHMHEGKATIDGNTFTGNGNYDIYIESPEAGTTVTDNTATSGINVTSGSLAAITGNQITYNDSRPLRMPADDVGELLNANSFNNLTAESYMYVQGGTISHDATWPATLPYRITGNITIEGTDGDDGVTTLTIEPGAVLRFNANLYLSVGSYSSSHAPGAMVAGGTDAEPITFTANSTSPTAGYWYNVKFETTSDDTISIMDHCIVEYAGGNDGGIYINNASPTIQNNIIRYCKNSGLYASGTGSIDMVLACNTFVQNDKGIYWSANPAPPLHQNNFLANTGYDLHYTATGTLNAEDNWWNTDQGPNAGAGTFSGNVDAEPWSTALHVCSGEEENQSPNTPSTPKPVDGAVRISVENGVTLTWNGGDPNLTDVVTYELFWGTSGQNLSSSATDLNQNTYTMTGLSPGLTYYWQILARDDKGAQTAGPVWRFTADGDPPDLIISSLVTDPTGNLPPGQVVTLSATVQNAGSGPAVDPFEVDFIVDGTSIGTATVNTILLSGASATVNATWTYGGGNPTIELKADSQAAIAETNEQNNTLTAPLSEVSDITPPAMVGHSPSDGAHLKQVQNVTVTLNDAQNTVDDAAVIGSFLLASSATGNIPGTTTESSDTFTFQPATLPLADGIYTVSLTAADNLGNTQAYQFSFTIDTTPPGKPIITGGMVSSGAIQPRPAENTAEQFHVELTGSRDPGTAVWINGIERIPSGDLDWSTPITLDPGTNAIEVWLQDLAGNIGPSEWVDIQIQTGSSTVFDYDDAGRVRRIEQQ